MGPKRPRLMLNGEKEEDSHLGSRIRLTFSFKTTHTRPTNALNEKSETFSSKAVVPQFLFAGLTGQDAWQVGICMHMHMGLEIPLSLSLRLSAKIQNGNRAFPPRLRDRWAVRCARLFLAPIFGCIFEFSRMDVFRVFT